MESVFIYHITALNMYRSHRFWHHTACVLWSKQITTAIIPSGESIINSVMKIYTLLSLLLSQKISNYQVAVCSASIPEHFPGIYILRAGNLSDLQRWRFQATISKLTSNARPLYCWLPYGWGFMPTLTEEGLITALWSPSVVFLVSYMKSWKVYRGLPSHGSAKAQRVSWQLCLGGAAPRALTSGCGLFMYVASGLLHQGTARAWKTCTRFLEWYKIKRGCDVGVWHVYLTGWVW